MSDKNPIFAQWNQYIDQGASEEVKNNFLGQKNAYGVTYREIIGIPEGTTNPVVGQNPIVQATSTTAQTSSDNTPLSPARTQIGGPPFSGESNLKQPTLETNVIADAASGDQADLISHNQANNPGFLSGLKKKWNELSGARNDESAKEYGIGVPIARDVSPPVTKGTPYQALKGASSSQEARKQPIGGFTPGGKNDPTLSGSAGGAGGEAGKSLGDYGNVAGAALQIGGSVVGTIQQNKSLTEGIDDINKSLGTLSGVKTDIGGSYFEDIKEAQSQFSESVQSVAVANMQGLKNSMAKIPSSNLNTGAVTQVALDAKENLSSQLSHLYDSKKAKTDEITQSLLTSAKSQTTRIDSTMKSLESRAKKMEEAMKMNRFNTGIDIAKAGLYASGVGAPVAMGLGMGMDAMKKQNEYVA